jgi:hypothetical protein
MEGRVSDTFGPPTIYHLSPIRVLATNAPQASIGANVVNDLARHPFC